MLIVNNRAKLATPLACLALLLTWVVSPAVASGRSVPNNRCSSNSPNGPGQTGPVGWLPDYGLANNVSWAAQSAHMFGLTGTEAFQNLAVSGSTPANWAPGGYLSPVLQQIGPLMKEVVSELLTAPSNHVVVSLYHLAIPSVTVFSAHQIGILFATFNAAISDAVGSLPQYGTRVAVMSPPRFFVGLGPAPILARRSAPL